MGGKALSVIFEAMLRYPESYNRGAPDLMFWRLDETKRKLGARDQPDLNVNVNHPPSHSFIAQAQKKTIDHSTRAFGKEDPFQYSSVFAVEVKSINDRWCILIILSYCSP